MNSLLWVSILLAWATGILALADGQVAVGVIALVVVLGPLLAFLLGALSTKAGTVGRHLSPRPSHTPDPAYGARASAPPSDPITAVSRNPSAGWPS